MIGSSEHRQRAQCGNSRRSRISNSKSQNPNSPHPVPLPQPVRKATESDEADRTPSPVRNGHVYRTLRGVPGCVLALDYNRVNASLAVPQARCAKIYRQVTGNLPIQDWPTAAHGQLGFAALDANNFAGGGPAVVLGLHIDSDRHHLAVRRPQHVRIRRGTRNDWRNAVSQNQVR